MSRREESLRRTVGKWIPVSREWRPDSAPTKRYRYYDILSKFSEIREIH